jgi:hypothetical protein
VTTPEQLNAAFAYFRSLGVRHGQAGDHAATVLQWASDTWAWANAPGPTEAEVAAARRSVACAEQAVAAANARELEVREQAARLVEVVAASLDRTDPLVAELDATLARWRGDPVVPTQRLTSPPSPRPRETSS